MVSVREIYKIDHLPIFQNRVYDTEREAKTCQTGNLRLIEDLDTGLVYNQEFNSDLMSYDDRYQNEQGMSLCFQKHLKEVSIIVEKSLGLKSIVEIGCGKGFFLKLLSDMGGDIVGFDPAYEGKNPNIYKCYYSAKNDIKAEGIILRHVLEHIKDPIAFLKKLKNANGGNGKIYIEVPCFDWICKNRAWYDIYYEHVNYFRLFDFNNMFEKIYDSGHLFGGQYIYVIADLSSISNALYNEKKRVRFPHDFTINLAKPIKNLSNYILVWGGASKGVIYSLLRKRMNLPVDGVVDINPAKQGKYLPVTGLRVFSPEEALKLIPKDTTIVIMNSNYAQEIINYAGRKYKYYGVEDGKIY